MPSRTALSELIENRGTLLEGCLRRVHEGEHGGGLFFDITFHYRLIAIASLLHDGDTAAFVANLVRSGRAHLASLRAVDRSSADETRFLCCANERGFEAAVAAGDLAAARAIASLQPTEFVEGEEYEEDFVWKRALYELLDESGDERARPLVVRLERIESDSSPLLAGIARALLERDRARYAESMPALVQRRRSRFEELARTPGFSQEHMITERHVFVLGLAIERIAKRRGLPASELPELPARARVPELAKAPTADVWMRPAAE